MTYKNFSSHPVLRESPSGYSSPADNPVFEVGLGTPSTSRWLGEIQGAHRLVQTLFQGELLDRYELLDFLVWPGGLFIRLSLKGPSTLGSFLQFLKERSTPAGESLGAYWDDELQWIQRVPAEKLPESTRTFLQTADRIRGESFQSRGFSPNLFFFYRNPRLGG
jgi:hypothetical protein